MDDRAIIWTEGKTDWMHLKHAFCVLDIGERVTFHELTEDFGDDQLLKQCVALARVPQSRPTIFLFDRDKPDIVSKVEDPVRGYKSWENNVYSFALPIPDHRKDQNAICIEFYYTDDELRTEDESGRRLFLSKEFNGLSGRHLTNPRLSIGNKNRLTPIGKDAPVRIIDSEVFNEQSKNVALSKAEFARLVSQRTGRFAHMHFDVFRGILQIVDAILEEAQENIDLPFGDLDHFFYTIEKLDKLPHLAAIVDCAVRACKLTAMTFAAATLRHYEGRIIDEASNDAKKFARLNRCSLEISLSLAPDAA